jgi:hypothetical protein
LQVTTIGDARLPETSSFQGFITEHYWGYARQTDGSTMEYHVEHPRWRVWDTQTAEFHCDIAGLYGEAFKDCLTRPPESAFLAEGSPVKVHCGVKIPH